MRKSDHVIVRLTSTVFICENIAHIVHFYQCTKDLRSESGSLREIL